MSPQQVAPNTAPVRGSGYNAASSSTSQFTPVPYNTRQEYTPAGSGSRAGKSIKTMAENVSTGMSSLSSRFGRAKVGDQ
eukprot:5878782-Prymnesium_polylepis.1